MFSLQNVCSTSKTKILGQGYDGCSILAGKDGGVQAEIKNKYPKAALVHFAALKLNLVVNELNAVPGLRIFWGTVKSIFFSERVLGEKVLFKVCHYCEKHTGLQSIKVFDFFPVLLKKN